MGLRASVRATTRSHHMPRRRRRRLRVAVERHVVEHRAADFARGRVGREVELDEMRLPVEILRGHFERVRGVSVLALRVEREHARAVDAERQLRRRIAADLVDQPVVEPARLARGEDDALAQRGGVLLIPAAEPDEPVARVCDDRAAVIAARIAEVRAGNAVVRCPERAAAVSSKLVSSKSCVGEQVGPPSPSKPSAKIVSSTTALTVSDTGIATTGVTESLLCTHANVE
jgi:hypothetical protein